MDLLAPKYLTIITAFMAAAWRVLACKFGQLLRLLEGSGERRLDFESHLWRHVSASHMSGVLTPTVVEKVIEAAIAHTTCPTLLKCVLGFSYVSRRGNLRFTTLGLVTRLRRLRRLTRRHRSLGGNWENRLAHFVCSWVFRRGGWLSRIGDCCTELWVSDLVVESGYRGKKGREKVLLNTYSSPVSILDFITYLAMVLSIRATYDLGFVPIKHKSLRGRWKILCRRKIASYKV